MPSSVLIFSSGACSLSPESTTMSPLWMCGSIEQETIAFSGEEVCSAKPAPNQMAAAIRSASAVSLISFFQPCSEAPIQNSSSTTHRIDSPTRSPNSHSPDIM
ncbi:Uncharacterised protein [uncultured archaeon]|nr:Uncharacterised protein [uncultured archaeon]